MKRLSILIGISLIGLAMLNSCKTVEPADLVVEEIDLCNHKATVLASDCGGLYLKTSNGIKVFAVNELDLNVKAGDQVAIGFYQFPSQAAESSSDPDGQECGGCYNGDGSKSGNDLNLDAVEQCMQKNGIAAASILCIKMDEEKDKGSKAD